jgi:hypothetical protein
MDPSALAARILKIDGTLLLVVALIHFAATPFAVRFVSSQSTPEAFVQIGPPFLLSFIVVGILLVPHWAEHRLFRRFFSQGGTLGAGDLWLQCSRGFPIARSPRDDYACSIFSGNSVLGRCDTGMDRRNLYDPAARAKTFWIATFNQYVDQKLRVTSCN